MEENTQVSLNGRSTRRQEDTIDLYQLWLAVRKHIWSIICVMLVGACIAADITFFLIPAQYTSSSLMLVLTKETTLQSIADLQIGTSLTNDYKILIQSRPVLEEVIDNLGLDMTYQQLRSETTVTNQEDTRILQISVEDTDPRRAKQIVDELSAVSSAYIGDKMEITAPKVIEQGEVPTEKTSPSNTRNTVIGALIGLLAALAVVVVNEIMNDTISTEEDVTQYLGLVTLSIVPERTGEEEHRSGIKNRIRKKKSSRKKEDKV